jgi:DNA-binding CsgD family transcriptional regulator
VHWADDATLDALRFLVRRIAGLPAVLVLTYRDDELGRDHALHGLLGLAARSERVRRLPLRRLSAGAVRALSASSPVDAGDLYTLTPGNPFFVSELLVSAQGKAVPPSIADAVLARVRRLDPATQDVLEQLAVVPAALERWLVDALAAGLAPGALAALAAALKFTEEAEFLGFLGYLRAAGARLEFGRSRWDAAARLAELGLGEHAQTRCPSLTLLGWARVRRGAPGGDGLLAAARDLAVQLGARPLAALVRGELRARGVSRIPRGPVGRTRAHPAGLTARQAEVLRRLGQGRTNAQIASELVVSVRTVDSHVAALLGKLGARDRRDAAARAAELGLLDAGDQ